MRDTDMNNNYPVFLVPPGRGSRREDGYSLFSLMPDFSWGYAHGS